MIENKDRNAHGMNSKYAVAEQLKQGFFFLPLFTSYLNPVSLELNGPRSVRFSPAAAGWLRNGQSKQMK